MTGDVPAQRKLLYFYRGEGNAPDPLASTLAKRGWRVHQVAVSDFAPMRGVLEVFRRRDLSSYDVVAATEYYLTWALCLRLLLRRHKPKIVALSFNQSRRLLLTRIGFVDRILNKVWRRASLFLVHSKAEAALFAEVHEIPADRFVFSHWGYDLPSHDPRDTPLPSEPYVTMIGRNNRDIATFCAAVERAGVEGVLVTAGYMLSGKPVEQSDNVLVLADRPVDECLNYVAGSFAHLVLVLDAERGAGHISSVSAMLLGKPQIFSDVAPLRDYLIDGFNGIAVPVGDVDAVVDAIRSLRDDSALRSKLGEDGRRFALEQLSYEASVARIAEALARVGRS
jgi:glycosyltransferase involved in cell wall biosynthesis